MVCSLHNKNFVYFGSILLAFRDLYCLSPSFKLRALIAIQRTFKKSQRYTFYFNEFNLNYSHHKQSNTYSKDYIQHGESNSKRALAVSGT